MRFKTIKLRFIFLMALCSVVSLLNAQEIGIKGTVKNDVTQEPVVGATIVIKGTTVGTATDFDGNYSIKADAGSTLVVSSIGFITKEVLIGNQQVLNITLTESTQDLGEVVVIGYGTVKKDDATGSVSVLGADDFNKGSVTTPDQLLSGKASGVVITSSGGAPGSGARIRIRGGSSLNASNDPLIIIDGVPISSTVANGNTNVFNFVNPNDIETFTVLKDASATAIYGSRASNGVILITTKSGKAGRSLNIQYTGNYSIATPIEYADVYSGDEMRQIAWDYQDIFDEGTTNLLGTENTNWQDEIFRTTFSHDHNISLSGSLKELPYRLSLGFTNQNGILENTDLDRFTTSLNLNPSLLDNTLKINASVKYMYAEQNFGDAGAVGNAIDMDPTQPIYDGNNNSDGYFQWENYGANLGTPNPVEQALAADNISYTNRFIGNVQIDYTLPFLKPLKAVLNIATDYTDVHGHDNKPATSPSNITSPLNGKLSDYTNTNKNNLLDFYINYNQTFAENHNIDAMVGYSWQHFEREGTSYTRGIVDAENPENVSDDSDFITENYLVSFFGRANYSAFNKYLLTGTVRYDGSSRFASDNQWGLFPSAAFAWKIKEESFLKDVKAVSSLKLRLGWGITGQQEISGNDYPAQALYQESDVIYSYYHGGEYITTLRPDAYDEDIKWEETTTQNIGLDFGFAGERITGSLDVYKRVTDDLLNDVPIPSGSNFSNTLFTNVGSLENKGAELSLNGIIISQQDISLDIGFNISYNESEITKLLLNDDPEFDGILYGDAMTGMNRVTRVGEAAYSFYLNKQVYYSDGSPVEGLYVDLDNSGGTVNGNNDDKYIYNNPTPDYTMGFSFNFNYKNFDISSAARANIGNYVLNEIGTGSSIDQMQQIGYWKNMPSILDEYKFIKRQFTSDYFCENASFVKIDYISAGYNFNEILNETANLRLNLTVQNVATFTKYSGLDPEIEDGLDDNFYPRPRTFTLGLSLTF